MTLKLPPLHLVIPPGAVYRKYAMPPDLFETWVLLRGLSWVNKYMMTPPASLDELLPFHHGLKRRALEYRLERLERTGWLTVRRASGKANVYVPVVPADKQIDYSVQATVHGGEPTSLRGVSPEESARSATGSGIESGAVVSHNTPAIGCTSFSSTVVVGTNNNDSFEDNLYQQQQSTDATPAIGCRGQPARALEETERIVNALWDLDICDERAVGVIIGKIPEMFRGRPRDFAHVTPEFVEDWVLHRRLTAKRGAPDLLGDGDLFEYALGGGFYRQQIREKRASPYQMSDKQRAAYRANWDAAQSDQDDQDDSGAAERSDHHIDPLPGGEGVGAPQPSPYRADGTADLWDRALGELKLQMTKATFDTWVRGSRALGWDDATGDLVIAVHSPYAKEWLEARLRATVARTLSGIAEREIAVRYEYQVNNGPAH